MAIALPLSLQGKRGLVIGIANESSIAAVGATLAAF
jgi:enoyl-[acyl-carrier-protein] reductase (NADH)